MQAGRAEPAVEFGGIEFNIAEVVRKCRLSDEIVDRFERHLRRMVKVAKLEGGR